MYVYIYLSINFMIFIPVSESNSISDSSESEMSSWGNPKWDSKRSPISKDILESTATARFHS